MSLAGKLSDITSDALGAHHGAHIQSGTVAGHAPADAIIIPDAHLLFTGDYKRAGVDLIVSGNDREIVLHDYFKGEKRAALASPDGAHLTGDIVNALAGYTQFAQADGSPSVAQVIGHVTKLTGSATAIRNGVSIILNQGDNVNKGDVVQSGSNSTLGITFIDGTVFGLASNAKMVLNEMIYDPNGSDNKSLLSLVQGTISFVAGATAKHGDMKVDTPVATMGIRGTAVLVEIDFEVPGQGSAPPAKFQVLVEPDGTTGSYILFDKITLTPIATVNQAGVAAIVNGQGGVNFLSSAQLSSDAQKIITDVFALKFSDLNNANTKAATNFTDSIVPINTFLKLGNGNEIAVNLVFQNQTDKPADPSKGATPGSREHIPGPPEVVTHNGATTERALTTGSAAIDSVTGTVDYADINPGDTPTVKTAFTSYTYQNAAHTDVTATLTAEQLAAIQAVEVPLVVVQDPAAINHGTATWTYNIADNAFDFLAAGETLTLTYTAHVDNNFAPNNEFKEKTFTITITGTNDKPTIATSGEVITELVGTGNTATDTATGTVTFTDVDLTDRPIVSVALSASQPFRYLDAHGHDVTGLLTPQQLAAIAAVEAPLTVVQTPGNAHNGSATWTYSVVDSAFDFLAAGETLTLNYVAQVDDGHGGVVSTPITVSITGPDVSVVGTNDVPTIVAASTTATGAMTEDTAATLSANGTITFQDLDLTDTHTAAFVLKSSDASANLPGYSESAPLSQIGAFVLTAISENPGVSSVGSVGWSFTLPDNDPVLQSLAVGQTITQVYTVTFDDGHGGTVSQDVTVVITGTNDAPVITSNLAAATGAVTEDAATPDLTTSGTLQIQDLDLIDSHTAGFVFSTSSSSAHLPGFTEGATHIGTFTIDPSVTESTSDTDNHATLGWSFTLPDNDPVLQSLAVGQTITQVYTVTFDDGHGGTVSQDVTVVITGTNDAPVITSNLAAATGAVTEDAATPDLTASGTLQIQDLDLIDSHTAGFVFSTSSSSAHLPGFTEGATHIGTFTIDPSVTESTSDTDNHATLGWSFTLPDNDPVLQSLAVGQTITQVYTVTFDDGHGGTVSQDVTVVITGTNDTPVVTSDASAATGAVTEDAATPDLTASGTLQIQDLDLIDSHTAGFVFSTSSSSAHLPGFTEGATHIGTFTIDPSVTESTSDTDNHATLGWSFTLPDNDPVLQSLAVGQTITQVYTVTFDDGHGGTVSQDVTVVITGTNDAPVVTSDASAATGAVTEDATTPDLTASGTLQIQDLDLIDSHTADFVFSTSSSSAHLPGFTEGATHIGTFTIDPSVTESTSDTDNHATLGWSFTLPDNDPVLQSLAVGQTITQVYTVTFDDGHGGTVSQDVTVVITGTNDTPVVAADVSGTAGSDLHAITEMADTTGDTADLDTTSGSLAFTDVDLTDTHQASQATPTFVWSGGTLSAGQQAALTAASTLAMTLHDSTGSGAGSVGFDFSAADNSFDFLADRQTLTITYDVTVADYNGSVATGTSSTQPVTITITGTNDVATIAAATAGSDAGAVTEDVAPLTVSGALTVSDADSGEAVFQAIAPAALATAHGSFTFNASSGAWTYTLDHDKADSLTDGQIVHDTLTVTSADGTATHDIDVTITGTNDVATIAATTQGSDTGAVTEDVAPLIVSGALTVSDVDSGEAVFQAVAPAALATAHGSFTFNASSGAWTYTLDHDKADSLTDGQIVHDTLMVTSADGTATHDIDVTITGSNDAPTASNVTLTLAPTPSAADGWEFDAANGHYYRLVTTEATWDQANTAATSDGAYLATITSQAEQDFIASLPGWDSVQVSAWTGGVSTNDVVGVGGAFFWQTGPEAGAAVDYSNWNAGEPNGWPGTDTGYLEVLGPHTYQYSGNFWNDAPSDATGRGYIEEWGGRPTDGANVGEDSTLTIASSTLLASATDPDTDDTLAVTSVDGTSADGATVTLSGNNIVYDPTNAATLQALGAGETITDTFSYTVSDGHGGTSTATVSLVVSGINDAPEFVGTDLAQTYHIGEGPTSIISNVSAADIDSTNYNHGWLTATVIAGGHQGDTLLLVDDEFISLVGNTVMYDYDGAGSGVAVEIGTLTDGTNSLRIDLNGNATDEALAKLAQAVEFQNTLSNAELGTRTVAFTLHDGGGTNNGGHDSAYFTANVDVTAAVSGNHAPALTAFDVPLGASDSVLTVYNLTQGYYSDADSDNLNGVAISHVDADPQTQGVWQYKDFYDWTTIDPSSVSDSHALAINYNSELRFVPVDGSDYTGAGSLTVYALDTNLGQSNGQTDVHIDVTSHGGSTHISDPVTVSSIGPVIATNGLTVGQDGNGNTTISGLWVIDPEASDSDTFTLTAVADSGGVDPTYDPSDLPTIQDDLDTGFTYTPGEASTDKVAVTVTDSHGASDTVNLIFNVAQTPQAPVTLNGTANKDVFFGTGYEDNFVFTANFNHDTIFDFTPGTDHIDLSAVVNTSDATTWFNQHVQAAPTNAFDTVVTIDAADTILLKNTTLASLQASDFLLHIA